MKIIYSDTEIIVVDKPGGLLSVPGRGPEKQDCVVSRIRDLFPDCISQPAVHRLDMFTSGIMVLGRTITAQRDLSLQFAARTIEKTYIALLDGGITAQSGRIELSFRLDIENRPLQVYDPVHGKTGITLWHTLSRENQITRVSLRPLTGRTHQLRVHTAHRLGLGTPIVGDSLYGRGREGDTMMLHASSITVTHPVSKKRITFSSAVPF